jgi:hypothetical protein
VTENQGKDLLTFPMRAWGAAMKAYDELEDYEDDFEVWAGVHEMIHRDAKMQFIEDLKSIDLTPKDLADLAQEWDDLVRDAAYPERQILKKWLKDEQEEEEAEQPE